MSKVRWIAATLLVVPVPVLAQIVFEDPPKKVVPAKSARPTGDVDKLECRRENITGTRVEQRMVCLTKQQWWQFEHDNKEFLEHIQALSGIGQPG